MFGHGANCKDQVLAVMTARSYLRGLSTLDTLGSEAAAKILVCFPSATAHTEFPSKVLQNTTGYRPYDLGLKGNWRRLRHQYLFKGPPCSRSSQYVACLIRVCKVSELLLVLSTGPSSIQRCSGN